MKYHKGDKVVWWSYINPGAPRDLAIFVRYDTDYPKEDAILAMRIGLLTHKFRWPLKYMKLATNAEIEEVKHEKAAEIRKRRGRDTVPRRRRKRKRRAPYDES